MTRVASKKRTGLRALMAAPLLIAIIALAAVALASYAAPAQAADTTLVTGTGTYATYTDDDTDDGFNLSAITDRDFDIRYKVGYPFSNYKFASLKMTASKTRLLLRADDVPNSVSESQLKYLVPIASLTLRVGSTDYDLSTATTRALRNYPHITRLATTDLEKYQQAEGANKIYYYLYEWSSGQTISVGNTRTISLTATNTAPVFTNLGSQTRSLTVGHEGIRATSRDMGDPVAAQDREQESLTYRILGPGGTSVPFRISNSGEITVNTFVGDDVAWTANVTANDGEGETTTVIILLEINYDYSRAIMTSANRQAAGLDVILNFDKDLDSRSSKRPRISDFTLTADGDEIEIGGLDVRGSARQVRLYNLSPRVYPSSQDVRIGYLDPDIENENTSGALQDSIGNDVQYFNNVRVSAPGGSSAPAGPITATFSGAPEKHDGEDAFAMTLTFDAELTADADDIRSSITITNGSLTTVAQDESDTKQWNLTVTPASAADVTVELRASPPCDEDGAICTSDGRQVETAVETTINSSTPLTTITSVSIVTTPGKNGTWDVDETVTVEVTFSAVVTIQGAPTLSISVGETERAASYASGDNSTTLRFSHQITADDDGATTAVLIADGFDTSAGSIGDTLGRYAVLDFDVAADSDGQRSSRQEDENQQEDDSNSLTATFENVPTSHAGEDERFIFHIQFSLEPDLGFENVRDHVLTVTNGEVTYVRRANPQADNPNSRWEITIEANSDRDITVTLPATTDCDDDGAVCTADDIMLSSSTSQTVPLTAVVTNSAATGVPTITGTLQVGTTITAGTSDISDADGLTGVAYTYQWLADDVDITGATGSTYSLADSDETAAIKVQVSFTDDAGNNETLTSAATAAVTAAPNNQASGQPTITGTTTTGSTLTAVTSGITDADGMDNAVFSYQWLRADAAISTATASTYTLVADDAGNAIKVRVSFTDDAGNSETLTSAGSASITSTPTNTAATGQPAISGSTTVGSVLTASTSGISDANGLNNATFAYQWLRDDANISNATSSTYTVAGEDEAHTVKVQVSFTDDDGFSESVTSAGTAIPLVPLTGHLANVPASHGGLNTTITFQLYFSVNPSLGFTNVRDNVLDVTNGTVTYVRRTDPQGSARNSRWEITVQPTGTSAVSVAFSPTTDCSADSAVCTSYGKMMSNSGSITVTGP